MRLVGLVMNGVDRQIAPERHPMALRTVSERE